ncbi:Copper fist DNA binding domain protein [Lasiodiplodia theobromae]|uniref:Copper fist DNA binding domain protein n=1 Tax=Lasiodiplodia theobromae TaxID=45133 RepID=UPI0015C30079|nr:Copper fist DNA binding domain protein [Lasiodiplodia theobromae]KAF4543261.1 Copper fist DNA binding domain protein [Lasiodiplodia theobromae]
MPILNGEKYACESCIKGHRVSGCTHSDRPLKHINPKGRPVKQCEHCQKARKTKSHHARCDCGTKKDKAKAEKAAAAAAQASASESEHDAHVNIETALSLGAPSQGCACHLGEKCLCGMKKDLDLKLDTGFAKNGQLTKAAKPRLTTAHSETTLTVFANGHHKPCHRLNNSAHTSGAPYRIPRHHTTHGGTVHKSHDNLAEMYSRTMDPARRSVDSLNLNNTAFGYFTPQSTAESVPMTPLAGSLENDCSIFDPAKYVYSQQSALSKMVGDAPEHHGLPMSESMPVHTYSWMNGGMYAPAPQYGVESISTSPTGDLTPDFDYNIPSAAADMTSNPYPWSAGDLPLDPNKLSDSLQPVSHSGESNRQSVPGMTTSSSGAQSEVGEPALFGDMDLNKMQQDPSVSDRQLINDPFQMRDPQSYRLSSASLSQQDVRPQMPTSVPANEPRQNLDLDFMQSSQDMAQPAAVFGTTALDSQPMFQTSAAAASSGFSDAAFTAPDFSAPMNAPQAGLDTSAPANPQGADWYNILGTGMGVNAFSVPVETMNNQNAEFPTWL